MIKFIGGLRWGNAFWSNKGSYGNATIPFATLEITNEHCIITRTFFGLKLAMYRLSWSDIEYVTIQSFLFNKGILFVHKNKNVPQFLLFWTFKPQKICSVLENMGIKVRLQSNK
ncbi:MAG: hypothetical protein E7036_05905 [Opitutales bacterium]|nr:hypothetical protein [Opitutales bacterium]